MLKCVKNSLYCDFFVLFQITNLMHNSFIFQKYVRMLHYTPQHVSSSMLLILWSSGVLRGGSWGVQTPPPEIPKISAESSIA